MPPHSHGVVGGEPLHLLSLQRRSPSVTSVLACSRRATKDSVVECLHSIIAYFQLGHSQEAASCLTHEAPVKLAFLLHEARFDE